MAARQEARKSSCRSTGSARRKTRRTRKTRPNALKRCGNGLKSTTDGKTTRMETRRIYFKNDFKIYEKSEAGYGVPFLFRYFTDRPLRCVEASFDGTEYSNCHVTDDGLLCVAFDDHGLGLGVLKCERRYSLTDEDFRDGVWDEVFPPTPLVCVDGEAEYNLQLSLEGSLPELNVTCVVPAYYVKGDKGDKGDPGEKGDKGDPGEKGDPGAAAKINGYNAITIEGDPVVQDGDTLTIDSYSKASADATATALGGRIDGVTASVAALEGKVDTNAEGIAALETAVAACVTAEAASETEYGEWDEIVNG